MNIGELVAMLRLDSSQFNDGVGDAEGQLRGAGGRLGTAAKAVGAAAGAAAGAGLSMAMQGAIDLEAANAKMQIQLGGSKEYAADIGAAAGNLFARGYADNIGDINDATVAVVKSGALMEDASNSQIESMTAKAMTLGKVYEQDVGMVAIAAGKMVQNGMADADTAMDVLAKGLADMGPAGDDLLETFQEYSPLMSALGLDAQTAMGLLKQGAGEGARNLDQAADAIKEFGIKAIDGSKAASAGYKALGLDADAMTAKIAAGGTGAKEGLGQVLDALKNMKDPVAQNTAAVGLFGTKWEDMRASLLAMDVDTASKNLGNFAGAAQQAADIMENTASQKVQGLKNDFDQFMASLISTQGPMGNVAAAMSAFGPSGIAMAGSLSMVGMAIGPLLLRLGMMGASLAVTAARYVVLFAQIAATVAVGVAQIVATLIVWAAQQVAQGAIALASMIATGAVYVAQWVAMAAGAMARAAIMAASWLIAMGPVGWVIALVVGLVALIIANWDTVKQWTIDAWAAVSGAVSDAWNAVTGAVSSAVAAVIGFVTNAWNTVTSSASNAWALLVSTISNAIGNVLSYVGALPGRILSALGNLGSLLINAGRDIITGLWNGIVGMGSWLSGKILGFIRSFVPGPVLQFLGIASPSKYFRDKIGRYIPEGLAGGIVGNAKVAADAARNMASDTADAAMGAQTGAAANGLPGDAWLSRAGDAMSGVGGGSRDMTVNVAINNPRAEKGSDSFAREMADLSEMGAFDL